MEFKKPRSNSRPEQKIQDGIKKLMKSKGWLVEKMHGNAFQQGVPDLYCFHPEHGARWIEVKTPKGRLTPAQFAKFQIWEQFNCPVWILISPDEYDLLFQPPNWRRYEKKVQKPKMRKDWI